MQSNRRVRPKELEPTPFDVPETPRRNARHSEAPVATDVSVAESKPGSDWFAVVRGVAGAVAVAAIATSVAWAARRYVTTSPRFAVTTIVVEGGQRRSKDDLIRRANIVTGSNIFSVELEDSRARLMDDPWIKDAILSRRLPGTIFVDVVEHEAVALLAVSDTYLVARDGQVIKRLEAGDPFDLPVITGVDDESLTVDRKTATAAVRSAIDLSVEYEASALGRKAPLQGVHVGRGGEHTLIVGKSGVRLEMGKKPYRTKLEQAARVLSEVEHQGAQADAIMLDNENRPDRVVVRMR